MTGRAGKHAVRLPPTALTVDPQTPHGLLREIEHRRPETGFTDVEVATFARPSLGSSSHRPEWKGAKRSRASTGRSIGFATRRGDIPRGVAPSLRCASLVIPFAAREAS